MVDGDSSEEHDEMINLQRILNALGKPTNSDG